MKSMLLAIVMLASVSSFGLMAPKGEYTALSCRSNHTNRDFYLTVVKNKKNNTIKMVLVAEGQENRVYPNVKEEVSPRVGGSTRYSALAPGGHIFLEYSPTSSPRSGGRAAILVSTALGRSTTTQMLCARPMY